MGSRLKLCETGGGVKKRIIKHYSSDDKILLVGEGDFSFAACLATAFGHASNIVATSLDSQEDLAIKHSTAAANISTLKDKESTIIHQVDVCNMCVHPSLKKKKFDRIVFNFPHASFNKFKDEDLRQIQLHQDLVRGFMKNARKMLTVDGEVHITHKTAYPFSEWNLEKLGKRVGLELIEEARFLIRVTLKKEVETGFMSIGQMTLSLLENAALSSLCNVLLKVECRWEIPTKLLDVTHCEPQLFFYRLN